MKTNIKYLIYFIIIISIFIFPNCRTMMINQTAETLNPKQKETSGIIGIGIGISPVMGSLEIDAGFQQRFGLINNVELQFLLLTDINFVPSGYPVSSINNYFKINPKFGLYSSKYSNLSILPYIGFFNSVPFMITNNLLYLGPLTGIQLIGSNKFPKKNNISIYYGGGFEIGENFYLLVNEPKIMLIDLAVYTSLGFEIIKHNLVMRHEFNFMISFNFDSGYYRRGEYYQNYRFGDEYDDYYISIIYGFSIGGLYSKNFNKLE